MGEAFGFELVVGIVSGLDFGLAFTVGSTGGASVARSRRWRIT